MLQYDVLIKKGFPVINEQKENHVFFHIMFTFYYFAIQKFPPPMQQSMLIPIAVPPGSDLVNPFGGCQLCCMTSPMWAVPVKGRACHRHSLHHMSGMSVPFLVLFWFTFWLSGQSVGKVSLSLCIAVFCWMSSVDLCRGQGLLEASFSVYAFFKLHLALYFVFSFCC